MCFLRNGRGFGGWKLALLALAAAAARAEASSSNSLVLVGAFERKSAITLQVPAQALVFQVQVRTSSDEWEVKLQEMETARSQLVAAATKQGFRVQVSQGVVLEQGYGKGFSSLVSSAGRSEIDVRSNLLLVAELTERSDLVDLVRRARVLLTRTPLPKGVSLGIGEVKLGIEEPEKFRPQLMQKIREHIGECAAALGAGVDVEVTGFEEPIMTRQVGERSVELSLPVRVNYTRKAR